VIDAKVKGGRLHRGDVWISRRFTEGHELGCNTGVHLINKEEIDFVISSVMGICDLSAVS